MTQDRRGSVAIILAVIAMVLFGLAGLAIDFSTATAARAQLDTAADAAALLATTAASNAYLAGAADPAGTGKLAGTSRFHGQALAMNNVTLTALNVGVTQTGTVFSSTVTYTGTVQTTLSQVVGVDTLAIHGAASASLSVNPYVDIQVLMDVSSSMTIAASAADISQMQLLTAAYTPSGKLPSNVIQGEACAFACHWTSSGDDYYQLAQRNKVQLRIDVLRSAVGNLVNNIAAVDTSGDFRLGLSTFSQSSQVIYKLSANVAGAAGALPSITPDINDCSSNCPDTYFSNAMTTLASGTATSGNGRTQATAQQFVFIVTDGVVDQFAPGRQITTIQQADCDRLKAKGITVLTLYTPYLPLPTNEFYNDNVASFQAQIGPALQSCATSAQMFFQASDASDIDSQLTRMLASVLQTSGHLMQ